MTFGNTIRNAMVVMGAAALLSVAVAAPAQAGASQQIRTERAGASFWDFGEDLVASDYQDNDGYSARASLFWVDDQRQKHRKYVYTDNGDDVDQSEKSFIIEEGTPVWLQLCYVKKNGEVDHCSQTQQGIA